MMASFVEANAASLHGDGEASDDGVSVAVSMPSDAHTMASCFPGDSRAAGGEVFLKPTLTEDNLKDVTDGDWKMHTHGDGDPESHQDKEGTFGILAGNWGADWTERALQDRMNSDLKSSPCAIIILQEAKHDLLLHLREHGRAGVPAEEGDGENRGGGGKKKWAVRPTSQFFGIRGAEPDCSLLIAARKSLVQGVRLLLFRTREDGEFKAKKKKGGEGKK